jgi:hypothetical protein
MLFYTLIDWVSIKVIRLWRNDGLTCRTWLNSPSSADAHLQLSKFVRYPVKHWEEAEWLSQYVRTYVSIRQYTSAHVSTRQHTSAYVRSKTLRGGWARDTICTSNLSSGNHSPMYCDPDPRTKNKFVTWVDNDFGSSDWSGKSLKSPQDKPGICQEISNLHIHLYLSGLLKM